MNDQSWLFSELGIQSHESFFLLVHKLILITSLQRNVPKLFWAVPTSSQVIILKRPPNFDVYNLTFVLKFPQCFTDSGTRLDI